MNQAADIQHILATARTVAVVGLSDKPERPSHSVARYLQSQGYRIVPINPNLTEVLGEKAYASLADAAADGVAIEVVDVFRKSDDVPPVVEEAIAIGADALWLQLGITHEDAAEMAEAAGLLVVQDRCMQIEHTRLAALAGGAPD